MATDDKNTIKTLLSSTFLLIILAFFSGLTFFAFQEYADTKEDLKMSRKIVHSVLSQQTRLSQRFAGELATIKEKLKATEMILGKVSSENDQLQERIKRLDENSQVKVRQIQALEETIARLEEENNEIRDEVAVLRIQADHPEDTITSLAQARKLITNYAAKINKFKLKVRGLKREAHLEKIAVQKEKDQVMLLMGNNGYLTRNGELSPVQIVIPQPTDKSISIDVTFVK